MNNYCAALGDLNFATDGAYAFGLSKALQEGEKMQAVNPASSTPNTPEGFGIRGDYQHQESTLTLREGLAEYYRVNPGLSVPAEIADEKSAAYFHSHDCSHVFFGTHTGVLDEDRAGRSQCQYV